MDLNRFRCAHCQKQPFSSQGKLNVVDTSKPTGNKQSAESHDDFGLRSSNHLLILQAASAGDLGLLEYSQALRLDLSLKADDGSTLLHCASRAGQPAVVRYLLDLGLSLEEKNDKKRTPLHEAILSQSLETVDVCLKADPDGSSLNEGHEPALHIAARMGYAPIVAALLSQPQVKVNHQLAREAGYSPLHLATIYGRKYAVRELLLHKDIDVNISKSRSNSMRTTPLHLAARYGHEDIVRLLLARDDINIDQVSGRLWTPIDEAVCNGHPSIATMILEDPRHGLTKSEHLTAKIYRQGSFFKAIEQGYIDVVRSLFHDALVDINEEAYNYDFNALGQAVFSGNLEMVGLLLQHHEINVNVSTTWIWAKETALHVAAKFGRVHATGLLLQHRDIDPNIKTEDGRLALHEALLHNHIEVARLLLEHPRIDVNARARVASDSEDEKTALDIARERGQTEIVHKILHRVDANIYELNNGVPSDFNEQMNVDNSQLHSAEQLLDELEWTREHE